MSQIDHHPAVAEIMAIADPAERAAARRAFFAAKRADFALRLEILEAEVAPPADVMTPDAFIARLMADDLPASAR